MKKYEGNLVGLAFNLEVTRIMDEVKTKAAYMSCSNCKNHGGECETWARDGKCGMYNLYSEKFRKPIMRCTECMTHFFSEDELVKVRETTYTTGRIDYRLEDGKPLIDTDECWEQIIDACPQCMTDDFLLDLKEDESED